MEGARIQQENKDQLSTDQESGSGSWARSQDLLLTWLNYRSSTDLAVRNVGCLWTGSQEPPFLRMCPDHLWPIEALQPHPVALYRLLLVELPTGVEKKSVKIYLPISQQWLPTGNAYQEAKKSILGNIVASLEGNMKLRGKRKNSAPFIVIFSYNYCRGQVHEIHTLNGGRVPQPSLRFTIQ